MKPTRVRVTQEMINVAIQRNRNKCAAVLGIKFADDDLERIEVDENWIRVSSRSEQKRYQWRTPPQVRQHISDFDLDKAAVKPFTFTLDPEKADKTKPVRRQGAATMAKRNARPRRGTGAGKPTSAREFAVAQA